MKIRQIWSPYDAREAARAAAMAIHPANPNHLQQLQAEVEALQAAERVALVQDGELTQEWDDLGAAPCPVVDLFTREVR